MQGRQNNERGFVLVTSLVILMILTVLLIGLYFRGKSNQESSVSASNSTKAYYLAEAGVNYIEWALYSNPSSGKFNNSNLDNDSKGYADRAQILNNSDQAAASGANRLGYFDVNNTVGYDPQNPSATKFSTVVANMPAHVELDIKLDATNTPSVTPNWGGGTMVPSGDGAVVWVVPAVLDATGTAPLTEKDTNATDANYAVYAYSIGYVNGKPLRLLRAKIGMVQVGFGRDLGSFTNGFQP